MRSGGLNGGGLFGAFTALIGGCEPAGGFGPEIWRNAVCIGRHGPTCTSFGPGAVVAATSVLSALGAATAGAATGVATAGAAASFDLLSCALLNGLLKKRRELAACFSSAFS